MSKISSTDDFEHMVGLHFYRAELFFTLGFTTVHIAPLRCTLPPNYSELYVGFGWSPKLRVCIRRSVDGNMSQKRADILSYVTIRLLGVDADNEVVMRIFGLAAELYFWKAREDGKLVLDLQI